MRGTDCGSGKIDVDAGGEIVHLDKPYQATLVETSSTPPTPPIIVNLSNTPIGNNLHLSPPKTIAGINVVAAAKSAAIATGDAKSSNNDIDKKDSINSSQGSDSSNTPSIAESNTTQQQQQQNEKSQADEEAADTQAAKAVVSIANFEKLTGIKVNDTVASDPNVFAVFQNNNPALSQIGWGYASLSEDGKNYFNISLPADSQVLVVVTQDHLSDAYNFNGNNAKAFGSITITQTYK
jgi:hypothetical protein